MINFYNNICLIHLFILNLPVKKSGNRKANRVGVKKYTTWSNLTSIL